MHSSPHHAPSTTRLLLLAALLASCAQEPPQIDTVKRFLDEAPVSAGAAALLRGEHVFAGSVARPALTAARKTTPVLRCDGDAHAGTCTASAPPDLGGVPGIVVLPPPAETSSGAASSHAVLVPAGGSVAIGALTPMQRLVTSLYPAPALQDRTIAYAPFEVPRGARLRFGIAIEEPAWSIDSAPVAFRIVADDDAGATHELYRRVLDPARVPGDRAWINEDLDLRALRGRKVALRFVSEPAVPGDARPSLPLWGAPRVLAAAAEAPRPSVVLVSLDTLRARSMSLYGNPRDTTPLMTALAARGATFDNVSTTFSNTLGAHMSMLTGLYPVHHRMIGRIDGPHELADDHTLLAQVFRKAGYATAGFTEDALLDSRFGFRRGFSTYYEKTAIERQYGDAAETFDRALEWASRRADEPFFLFVHTYQVHDPYDPPPEYRDLFPDIGGDQRAYEQEVRYVDDLLAGLVRRLYELVPEQRLMIVVTADHGEEFFEHRGFRHAQLFDEVMHVPLLMVWPGTIPGGVRVPVAASLVDLVPTILGLVGLTAPSGIDGVDLGEFAMGRGGSLERDVVLGEYPKSFLVPSPTFVARSLDAKCLVEQSGENDVCYDLRSDRAEGVPLPPDAEAAFARPYELATGYRTRALAQWRVEADRARARREAFLRGIGAGKSRAKHDAARDDAAPQRSDAIERKLRALGYVE